MNGGCAVAGRLPPGHCHPRHHSRPVPPPCSRPRFYLPAIVGHALELTSKRWPDGRWMEASRRRDTGDYSVICDPETAGEILTRVEALRGVAELDHLRQACVTAAAAIRAGLAEAAGETDDRPGAASDRERGLLGL